MGKRASTLWTGGLSERRTAGNALTPAPGRRGPGRRAAPPPWAAQTVQGLGMDPLRQLLDALKQHGEARGNFLGLLNVLIGRRVTRADGTVVSTGVTWRELAALLKRVRWEKDAVRELSLDPAALPPRDRHRFWYVAIAQAHVDSDAANRAGDELAEKLGEAGYEVGPGPQGGVGR